MPARLSAMFLVAVVLLAGLGCIRKTHNVRIPADPAARQAELAPHLEKLPPDERASLEKYLDRLARSRASGKDADGNPITIGRAIADQRIWDLEFAPRTPCFRPRCRSASSRITRT